MTISSSHDMETPDKPAVFKAGRSIAIKGSRNANTTLEKDGPKTQKSAAAAFDKLDPDQFARRIEQRRRAVQHGKNTVGYEEYRKQVPKEERRPRSMQHPSTPDPTLDIPTKRWQGLVKAWRKALHQYDPPDLAMAFAAESEQRTPKLLKPRSTVAKESPTSIADRSEEWLSWSESPSREEQWGEEVLNDSDDELL